MTPKDLKQYLAMLDKKSVLYRAVLVVSPGDEVATRNLKKLDQFAVKAINQYHNESAN